MNVLDVIRSSKVGLAYRPNLEVTIDVRTAAIYFIIYRDKVEIVDALTNHVITTLERGEIEMLKSLLAIKKPKVDIQISKTTSINGEKFIFTIKRPKGCSKKIEIFIGDGNNKVFLDQSTIKELPTIMKILQKLRGKLVTE